jgi:hypothetical protein
MDSGVGQIVRLFLFAIMDHGWENNVMEITDVYECPQCKNRIALPPEMTEQDQEEIARICRSSRKLEAMKYIFQKFKLGLIESKVIMVHVSTPKDHCVNCGNKLLETGITYCPSCSGLNLNW